MTVGVIAQLAVLVAMALGAIFLGIVYMLPTEVKKI